MDKKLKVDLSSLEKAINSLEKGIKRSLENVGDEELRDAVIQRFEYTYELCCKMLKRKIEIDHPSPADVDAMSFKVLFREGQERRFILDVEKWMIYREQRNITSHVYDTEKAKSVYKTALEFFEDAKFLLNNLKNNND